MKKFEEIEYFYKRKWEDLLQEWYVDKLMSAPEISEKIQREINIDFTCRAIIMWARKLGINRPQAESMRNRVITGRMVYENRPNFYEYRRMDYKKMFADRGYLWAAGLPQLLRKQGALERLVRAIGCDKDSVRDWVRFYRQVGPEYQGLICSYFGMGKNKIFSIYKPYEVEKKKAKSNKAALIRGGYKYATNLKTRLYAKNITVTEFAERLGVPFAQASEWASCRILTTPTTQLRIAHLLKMPVCSIFSSTKPKNKNKGIGEKI